MGVAQVSPQPRYALADGTPVRRVSEVLDCIMSRDDAEGLADFAFSVQRQDRYATGWRPALEYWGDVGTSAHELIRLRLTADMEGVKFVAPDWLKVVAAEDDRTHKMILCAYRSFELWYEHALEHRGLELILVEESTVSEAYRYGGTPDLVCMLDGLLTIVDWKTSSRKSFESKLPRVESQLAAYVTLVAEKLMTPPSRAVAVRLCKGWAAEPEYEERPVHDLLSAWKRFGLGLQLHDETTKRAAQMLALRKALS